MRIVVLGSAAGGGFPQWNSNAQACCLARSGSARAYPRTQASLAVSGDDQRWFLLNASPDLGAQINAQPLLWPCGGLRSSPIAGTVLTGGDVDAIAGLLTLRERHPFALYATQQVMALINANPIFGVLAPDCVVRRVLPLDTPVALTDRDDALSVLNVTAFAVPGKEALWREDAGTEPILREDGTTIGLQIAAPDSAVQFFFIPNCARMTGALKERLRGAPLVFFDGTLWQDDEMIRLGVGNKTGRRMGHMSMDGEGGTMAMFRDLGVASKVFLHVNNTNPVLLEDSPERATANAAGWTIAADGMEFVL